MSKRDDRLVVLAVGGALVSPHEISFSRNARRREAADSSRRRLQTRMMTLTFWKKERATEKQGYQACGIDGLDAIDFRES